ncbi:ABC transporter substrate-binding protein [Acidomonas methanolica]|uniref:ABC transporter substrate-binding protein n=1 Tax=Acidomonas methanolica TaxID=437 RepID=UPI00211A27F4|nr:ABC transporter substrate-binding protein [Acidomonas methanolica]MCQ9155234.1 ABC transporter substrate-binding protein [Acidomonas methanolica]
MTVLPAKKLPARRGLSAALLSALIAAASLPMVVSGIALAPSARAQSASAASGPIATLYAALTRAEAPDAGTPEARAALIGPAIDQAFDLETVLRNSVGLRYAGLSADEKAKLLQAFRDYTVARYVSNFKPGAGAKFTIAPATRPSPFGNGVIVDTTIGGSSDTPTAVDYVMQAGSGGYRIVDVLLDAHISQVATQRADFSSALNSGGVPALIALMNRKTQTFMQN